MQRVIRTVVILLFSLLAAPANSAQEFIAIAYHDVVSDVALRHHSDPFSVSAGNLAAHFAWLQHHGYTPVSIDDLIAASRNERPLPDKAVLLTFDDGLKSLYTHVYPLLKIFGYPAVASVVTDWLDYGHENLAADRFITWEEAREMQKSGLVEFASHSADLHHGIVANPQANLIPAGAARAYRGGVYESDTEFQKRISADLQRSMASIERALGASPRIMTWPFGKYALSNLDAAQNLGMPISMTLEVGRSSSATLSSIGRILVRDNPGIRDFSTMLSKDPRSPVIRALQARMDDLYAEDAQQLQSNLDHLVERVKELQVSHVFLQAVGYANGGRFASSSYFPNRHLPLRADLFSHVAWQLKTRSDVRVFAQMPLLIGESEPGAPAFRRKMHEIYHDLAVHADFDGVVFHDTVATDSGWLEPRERELIRFSHELIEVLRESRPELKTARSLCVTEATSSLPSFRLFLDAYDHVLLMAPPGIVNTIAQTDAGMEQTIYGVHVADQCSGRTLPVDTLGQQMRSLQATGLKHLAVDPGDVTAIGPIIEQIWKGMSLADYPFRRR